MMKQLFNAAKQVNSKLLFLRNYLELRRAKVAYKTFPVIYGKLVLKNNGQCIIGENVTFKSSPSSNYVGLAKGCSVYVDNKGRLEIGSNSGFSGVSIYCAVSIKIGSHVNCGGNVSIWDTDFHPLEYQDRRVHDVTKIQSLPVQIGDDVFLGANSIVLKGVTIGSRSIIGAGSVVTKSIPEDEVWAGNPARFIKKTKH